MATENSEELGSSELGTKEYWDKTYKLEMRNFADHGDPGEIWFGEDSSLRVVRWMSSSELVHSDDRIIDVGCGNGMLLGDLANEDFTDLTGIDYSEHAIQLARNLAKEQNINVRFEVCDILSNKVDASMWTSFQVVLDKGTYDAVSLNPDNTKENREKYIEAIWKLLKPNGLFLITSCNWTKEELTGHCRKKFKLIHVIPTPSFKFGGKIGSVVTSVVFQKID